MKNKKKWSLLKMLLTLIITNFICIIFGIVICYQKNNDISLAYNSTQDIDYKVYLIDNNFFKDDYLEKGNQYISEIVDYINIKFKYKFNIADYMNLNSKYKYKIISNLQIIDKENGNILYNSDNDLLKKELTGYYNSFKIDEEVKIDYKKYNEIVCDIINKYDLQNIKSELKISLKVDNLINAKGLKKQKNLDSTISASIPLNIKTFNIRTDKRKIDTHEDNYIKVANKNINNNSKFVIMFMIVIELLMLIGYIILKVGRMKNNYQLIYNREINRIIKKYGCFIQRVYNTFDLTGYQIIRVRDFKNLLDIMEIINSPILMLENKTKDGCFFVVITNTKFIYVYGVKVSEIKKRLNNKDN